MLVHCDDGLTQCARIQIRPRMRLDEKTFYAEPPAILKLTNLPPKTKMLAKSLHQATVDIKNNFGQFDFNESKRIDLAAGKTVRFSVVNTCCL